MNSINDILTWKQNFGLLPIQLIPTQAYDNSFIMHNGGHGDFCLETIADDISPEIYNALSWSSNTKNFVVLDSDIVKIYNWKKNKTESIPKNKVEDNFETFYKYLVSNNYKTDNDLIPFVIDIFKQFRNFTHEKNDATEALNLLFLLLAGIEEDLNNFDFKKWGLSNIDIPQNFEYYLDRLKKGSLNITPKLDLIIRHSAGALFQEAQKEVITFDQQIDLWGTYSNKIKIQKSFYSSIHYTPSYLARAIVENALRQIDNFKSTIKIFDPACGSSEFLIETLKQLHENKYLGTVQIIGWDSSETAINTSKFLLTYEKRTIWKERLVFDLKHVGDSLTEEWMNDYDLILMNPPFVSWEQLGKNSREAVKSVINSNITGKPNQASAFLYKAVLSLNTKGVIGCVVPSSLFLFDAYQKLRQELNEFLNIDLIGKLGNFIFEDAFADVSFIIGHKPKNKSIPYVLWAKNEKGVAQDALRDLRKMHYSQSYKVVEKEFSIYQPTRFPITKENWKPISFFENELFKSIERFVIENKLVKIQNVFNVKQGIRTGNNAAFKISSNEFSKLSSGEEKYFRPVIDNESIIKGLINKTSYVWYPYDETGLIIKTEEELIAKVPVFYETTLKKYKSELCNRARKDLSNWWQLSEHRAWLRKQEPRLYSTEFGKSDSFAFDSSGEFAVERGNAWVPKKEFKNNDPFYFYLALFSSPFFDNLLSIYSRQLAGGNWYDLGKKFTQNIPIPDVHSIEVINSPAYFQLIELGKDLSKGDFHLKAIIDDILFKYFYPQSQDY